MGLSLLFGSVFVRGPCRNSRYSLRAYPSAPSGVDVDASGCAK